MKFSSQVLFLSAFATTRTTQSFIVGPSSYKRNSMVPSSKNYNTNEITTAINNRPLLHILYADADAAEGAEGENTTTEEETPKEEEASPKEEKEQEEDPEIKALKEELSNNEAILKNKKQTLTTINESVEEYTETGFARRVAQMEDVKRVRMGMQNKNTGTALASVVQNFLPVLDELTILDLDNKDTKVGVQFSGGLTDSMKTALQNLGVEEFNVKPGDAVDKSRMQIIEERYSDEYSKDTVIRPILPTSVGRELNGNIMQMVEVVVSMGSEEEAKKKAAEEEAAKKKVEEAAAAEKDDTSSTTKEGEGEASSE